MPKRSVAVQTSPRLESWATSYFCLVQDIRPKHFTTIQTTKLEDAFNHQNKPDTITMQILAMESNLLSRDVEVRRTTFKAFIHHLYYRLFPTNTIIILYHIIYLLYMKLRAPICFISGYIFGDSTFLKSL